MIGRGEKLQPIEWIVGNLVGIPVQILPSDVGLQIFVPVEVKCQRDFCVQFGTAFDQIEDPAEDKTICHFPMGNLTSICKEYY
jgi:hypothetical protein